MEWLDILHRIESGEDARTEFKRTASNISSIRRTLCAFANGDGGLLVVGVDNSGRIVGVEQDADTVQERFTSSLQNGCGRPVTAVLGRHLLGDQWVHWIDVQRHQRGYEPFNTDGRFWIRRGRSTVAPSPSELQELFNVFGLVLTEQQTISSATVDDIDFGAFRKFMKSQGKQIDNNPQPDIENDLLNASVCDWQDEVLHPTLYGLMVFGRDPQGQRNTTSFFIQCAAYAGTDQSTDVLSAGEGKGRIDEQVQRAVGWVQSLGRKEVYRGLRRIDCPVIPESVLREVLVNAVIHRDYALTGSQILLEMFDDRVDVTSPGALPNHMTVEQARSGGAPRSRNEMMANAMVVHQLMERRGRGWLLMRHGMRSFNGTEPRLLNDKENRCVRVSFCLDGGIV
ncbi:MAG: putative DNA binding domain-containing protein [Rhodobacteraceae bacterium]|nr:putative DNA binding domain-containing protein [Paracoccaceae bacterium]